MTVGDFAQAAHQQPVAIVLEQAVPITAPDDFDDVPSGAAENSFEFLNDFAVAADWAIETLQVAVDDPDQIVEPLTRGEGDRAERFRLVHFAVAEKCPNFAAGGRLQPAIFQVLDKSRVIDGLQRAKTHADGGELPEIGHEPGVRIGRETAAGVQFAPKIISFSLGRRPSKNARAYMPGAA